MRAECQYVWFCREEIQDERLLPQQSLSRYSGIENSSTEVDVSFSQDITENYKLLDCFRDSHDLCFHLDDKAADFCLIVLAITMTVYRALTVIVCGVKTTAALVKIQAPQVSQTFTLFQNFINSDFADQCTFSVSPAGSAIFLMLSTFTRNC